MNSHTQPVVLVSGGSKGLGAAVVEKFLVSEYKVATFSRKRSAAIDAWENHPGHRGRFYYSELDATDRPECKRMVREVARRLGTISILVNNAGTAREGLLPIFRDEDIDYLLDLNLKSVIYLTKLVVRPMLTLGWGRVINISSIVGLCGYRGLSVYGATKAGLDGFTRALARELGPRNITVNSVAPGYLPTELTQGLSEEQVQNMVRRTPVGRLGELSDVVSLVYYLASDEAAFITGQTLVVDGGLTC
jgi:3-oxoacyl-[acyl-carrier protein] reductase